MQKNAPVEACVAFVKIIFVVFLVANKLVAARGHVVIRVRAERRMAPTVLPLHALFVRESSKVRESHDLLPQTVKQTSLVRKGFL